METKQQGHKHVINKGGYTRKLLTTKSQQDCARAFFVQNSTRHGGPISDIMQEMYYMIIENRKK